MDLLLTTIIVSVIAATICGLLHDRLAGKLGPVQSYTSGSLVCLGMMALGLLVKKSWEAQEVLFLAVGIWGATGLTVLVLNRLDKRASRRRLSAAKGEAELYGKEGTR